MARGSGITGLGAMARVSLLPSAPPDIGREGRHVGGRGAFSNGAMPTHSAPGKHEALLLVRPLIDLPKVRLSATLAAIGLSFVDDPSNRDPRFTRARLRTLMPALAAEGLDAQRLAMLARRLRRAEAAIELGVDAAVSVVSAGEWTDAGPIAIDAEKFFRLPAEVALRLLGRAIAQTGDEGPVELGKLETLFAALLDAGSPEGVPRMRRTLAGALVTLSRDGLRIARAPPRSSRHRSSPLTTRGGGTRTPSHRL
jgi:tRNA(Ile)-lysidine synthase